VLNFEKWKEVPKFNLYECSNTGFIRNKNTKKILKFFRQNSGYYQVDLHKDGYRKRFLVHRLIAITWISNPNNYKYINHIDGNKINNNISNLEWCTNSENIKHARKTGLNPYNNPTRGLKLSGQRKGASKYFGVCFDKSRNKWKTSIVWNKQIFGQKRFDSELEAAKYRDEIIKKFGLENKLPLNFK
jgi:hypothetical protein